MAFEIAWLESARKELDAEIEYVYSEFGEDSARRARTKIRRPLIRLILSPIQGCGAMVSCIAVMRYA